MRKAGIVGEQEKGTQWSAYRRMTLFLQENKYKNCFKKVSVKLPSLLPKVWFGEGMCVL